MTMPLSKGAILGILFALFVLGVIVYQTVGLPQYECEVCMELDGRTKCEKVKGVTDQQAIQTAKESACSFITNGRAEAFRCNQSPPASVNCKHL